MLFYLLFLLPLKSHYGGAKAQLFDHFFYLNLTILEGLQSTVLWVFFTHYLKQTTIFFEELTQDGRIKIVILVPGKSRIHLNVLVVPNSDYP